VRVKSKAVEEREKFEWMNEHMSAMARAVENTHLKDDIRRQMHELFTVFRNDISELRQLVSKKDNGGGREGEEGGGGEGELPPIRDAKEASRARIRRGSQRHGEAEAATSALAPISRRRARRALQNEAHSPGSVLAEGGGEGGEEGGGGGGLSGGMVVKEEEQ
jgi:hypothetical protein